MKKILIILSLFNLISCGDIIRDIIDMGKKKAPKGYTDPVFVEYIDKFNNEFNVIVNHIPIYFDELEEYSPAVGACFKWSSGERQIKIKKSTWENFTKEQKEVLVYHELGHCFFERGHNNGILFMNNYHCPESIMRYLLFSKYTIDNCYNFDYNYYQQELQNGN